MKKHDLEDRTVNLVNALRGHAQDRRLDDYAELAINLEWRVAFEMPCEQSFEFYIAPTEEELTASAALGQGLGLKRKHWQQLQPK